MSYAAVTAKVSKIQDLGKYCMQILLLELKKTDSDKSLLKKRKLIRIELFTIDNHNLFK